MILLSIEEYLPKFSRSQRMFDITVIIVFHKEGEHALPALSSMAELVSSAREAGLQVEARAVLDRPNAQTRRFVASRGGWLDEIEEVSFGDPGLTRNEAAKSAKGKFLAFLDGDDLWGSDWLTLAYLAATASGSPSNAIWHPESMYLFYSRDFDRQSVGWNPHPNVESFHFFFHPSADTELSLNTLFLESLWSANVFALRSIYLQHPYRATDSETGIGFEDWSWHIETVWAGIPHCIVADTVHIIRVKEVGSQNERNTAEGRLPYLSESIRPRYGCGPKS